MLAVVQFRFSRSADVGQRCGLVRIVDRAGVHHQAQVDRMPGAVRERVRAIVLSPGIRPFGRWHGLDALHRLLVGLPMRNYAWT